MTDRNPSTTKRTFYQSLYSKRDGHYSQATAQIPFMEQTGSSYGMSILSPKLIQILKYKMKLTDEQIIGLSDAQSWAEVRKVDEQRRAEREALRQIRSRCLLGTAQDAFG